MELSRRALESKDFRLSKIEMDYMECNFNKIRNRDGRVKIKDHEISKSDNFWYLKLIIYMGRLKRMLSIGLSRMDKLEKFN